MNSTEINKKPSLPFPYFPYNQFSKDSDTFLYKFTSTYPSDKSNFPQFIRQRQSDSSVADLFTPINQSSLTRVLMCNLPAYRRVNNYFSGFEVGIAHGYFLLGPFYKTGPLRNSEIGLLAGFMSTVGLIIILTVALKIYILAQFVCSRRYGMKRYTIRFPAPEKPTNVYSYGPQAKQLFKNLREKYVRKYNRTTVPLLIASEKKKWERFLSGFIVGGIGGASFAYLVLSSFT